MPSDESKLREVELYANEERSDHGDGQSQANLDSDGFLQSFIKSVFLYIEREGDTKSKYNAWKQVSEIVSISHKL